MKQSVIIAFLGKTQDRFCEYNSPKTTYEKLQMVCPRAFKIDHLCSLNFDQVR